VPADAFSTPPTPANSQPPPREPWFGFGHLPTTFRNAWRPTGQTVIVGGKHVEKKYELDMNMI